MTPTTWCTSWAAPATRLGCTRCRCRPRLVAPEARAPRPSRRPRPSLRHRSSGGRHDGVALARVEDPGLQELAVTGLLAQLVHGARQRQPVEELVLARLLQLVQREVSPGQVVASLEGLE